MTSPARVNGICLDNRQRVAKSFSDPGRRRDRERFVLAPELTGHHRVFACTAGVNFNRLNQPTRLVFPHGPHARHPHRFWTGPREGQGLRPYLFFACRVRVNRWTSPCRRRPAAGHRPARIDRPEPRTDAESQPRRAQMQGGRRDRRERRERLERIRMDSYPNDIGLAQMTAKRRS
jgi:hypothetical protein